jgi:addiction module RelE/StbE family toxin
MAKISWTRKSIRDLQSIHEFISLDSKFYANRFINKIVLRVEQLIEFPESGRIIPEKEQADLRELIEGNYRIFYRIQKNNVTILRIHNSAKNIK